MANGWRVVSNQMWPIKDQSFPIMYLLSICIYALRPVMQFLRFCPRTFPLYSSIVHRFAIILKLVQYLDRSKLRSNIYIHIRKDCVSIQPFALRYSLRDLARLSEHSFHFSQFTMSFFGMAANSCVAELEFPSFQWWFQRWKRKAGRSIHDAKRMTDLYRWCLDET